MSSSASHNSQPSNNQTNDEVDSSAAIDSSVKTSGAIYRDMHNIWQPQMEADGQNRDRSPTVLFLHDSLWKIIHKKSYTTEQMYRQQVILHRQIKNNNQIIAQNGGGKCFFSLVVFGVFHLLT